MTIQDFDQIDSRAYLVHPWMKYPKFGIGMATVYASRFVRYGMISRKEAIFLLLLYVLFVLAEIWWVK